MRAAFKLYIYIYLYSERGRVYGGSLGASGVEVGEKTLSIHGEGSAARRQKEDKGLRGKVGGGQLFPCGGDTGERGGRVACGGILISTGVLVWTLYFQPHLLRHIFYRAAEGVAFISPRSSHVVRHCTSANRAERWTYQCIFQIFYIFPILQFSATTFLLPPNESA